MDVSLNPRKASEQEIVSRLKTLGSRIVFAKRRFVAMMPEINRRRIYLKLNYDNIYDLARIEAEFTAPVVRRIINTGNRIQPFPAFRRLFENSDIGWTKFETISKVLDSENAVDFLWHLKNNTPKKALEEIADEIKRQRKQKAAAEKAAAEKAAAEKAAAEAQRNGAAPTTDSNNTDGGTGRDDVDTTDTSGSDNDGDGDEASQNSEQSTLFGSAYRKGPGNPDETKGPSASTEGCTCTCGCNHKRGVGQVFQLAGKAAINVTLYAHVAEALQQRADMLEKSKSGIADLSKVVEDLLFANPEGGAQDKGKTKPKAHTKKREREVHIVTYDKEKDIYSARCRYGDYVLKPLEVRELSCNYGDPFDLHELRERAVDCANEYMANRIALGKELTDHIPKLVDDFLFYRSRGYFCEFPGCCCRGFDTHHLERKARNKSCHPDRLVVLCLKHHMLAHYGAIGGEDGPICDLHVDISQGRLREQEGSEIARIDALYRRMRVIAARKRHQPKCFSTN